MNKRRILIISTVGLIYDGVTSVIVSYLEAMDLTVLDIRVAGTIKIEPSIREKIESLGCKIVDLPNRRTETFHYFNRLRDYVRKEKIDVVHVHGNSATLAVDLLAAKLGGCKKRIAHSHNTKCEQVLADALLRPFFYLLYTDALACGEDAGKWLYGNRPFNVLRNGRNVEKYKFNPVKREEVRTEFGLKDELVIGHVGGFFEQKNHKFLILIFREVLKKVPNAKLFLIGNGPLRDDIQRSVHDIRESIVFLGTTDHVEDYLNMMDVMVFPSLFEGLPLVVIEWQINGLPCLISDTVTEECMLCDTNMYVSLSESPRNWCNRIPLKQSIDNRLKSAERNFEIMKNSAYNISISANELLNLYED